MLAVTTNQLARTAIASVRRCTQLVKNSVGYALDRIQSKEEFSQSLIG